MFVTYGVERLNDEVEKVEFLIEFTQRLFSEGLAGVISSAGKAAPLRSGKTRPP
jgi:hypothetical protein